MEAIGALWTTGSKLTEHKTIVKNFQPTELLSYCLMATEVLTTPKNVVSKGTLSLALKVSSRHRTLKCDLKIGLVSIAYNIFLLAWPVTVLLSLKECMRVFLLSSRYFFLSHNNDKSFEIVSLFHAN